MLQSKRKRGKKQEFNFSRAGSSRKRRAVTEDEATNRQRMVEEFIRRNGVTRCPAGYSHMDW